MKHVIITGASKGLGFALAKQYVEEGAVVHTLSRSEVSLEDVNAHQVDISQLDQLEHVMTTIFDQLQGNVTELLLINNAGVVEPVGRVGSLQNEEIASHFTVNLTAPVILANLFVKLSESYLVPKTVLNISSGAGRSPMDGWNVYCSGKSGLDMFTKTAAVEQEEATNPIRFYSLAPGIIDTNMQSTIRNADQSRFKHVDKFKAYKEDGNLVKPEVVSDRIIHGVLKDTHENGALLSIRDYL
ncbi:(S)-benzoin forming benzil reductase [Geomicrobium sp. JCM 19038]|uniref:(S)-benzoin forming benzil reductase n=1 Tax=Geomicrobium sp. JCM 19038 TaxID=1460635 RepID=UPI00045F16A8|nr:(S)-benzoin forming benzil reductase [Geomicrobium sp. JCM 19038]GAK09347.1 dehydrogenase [Geomicrobium sp. JCM 19038]